MKYLFAYLALLTAGLGYAQNYSTINPYSETYFAEAKKRPHNPQIVIATRFDSVEMDGKNLHYFSFQSLRMGSDYIDPSPGTCDYIVGHSWVGPRVIQDSMGWDHFFNDSFERISIHRGASFNDTFIMYRYASGYSINAIVTGQFWAEVLGKYQRIKVFTLISDKPGFPNNEISFELSEHYGWTKWFNPSVFPDYLNENFDEYLYLEGLLNDTMRKGVTRLTVGDVFDFKVGDVFNRSVGYGLSNRYEWLITHRTDYPATDQVMYNAILTHRWFEYSSKDNYTYQFNDTSKVTLKYDSLSNFFVTQLPGELIVPDDIYKGDFLDNAKGLPIEIHTCDDFTYVTQSTYGINPGFLEWYSDSCIDLWNCVGPDDEYAGVYGTGIGAIYDQGRRHLGEFHKSGTSCGEPSALGISISQKTTPQLYPNPSSGLFHLEMNNVKNVEVYSSQGHKVLQFTYSNHVLNLESVSNGMYHVLIYTPEGVLRQKVVKIGW